ncbi:hypothetical protein WJX72_005089 [[Myrmecia] bisecta]|uniref:RRM domain-containing protein n=1 Tax=[Myrmecia] bisecta TaxID=41462 RepID=A0AAW1PDK5_9CHLO
MHSDEGPSAHAMAEQEQAQAEPTTSGRSFDRGSGVKLFLGGLSWQTTQDTIRTHFQQYGPVGEVIIKTDPLTGRSRSFGFVTVQDVAAAERVCQEPHVIDGREIDVKRSIPQGQVHRQRSRKLFVGGLAAETTSDDLERQFSQYGKIIEAQVMIDHASGRSRGFAFLTFEDEAAADKVFAAGSMHEVSGKMVEVKPATPRGSGPVGHGGAGPSGLLPPYARGAGPGRGYAGAYSGGYPGPLGYGMMPGYDPRMGGMGGSYPQAYGYAYGPQMGGYGSYGYGQYGYGVPQQAMGQPSGRGAGYDMSQASAPRPQAQYGQPGSQYAASQYGGQQAGGQYGLQQQQHPYGLPPSRMHPYGGRGGPRSSSQ